MDKIYSVIDNKIIVHNHNSFNAEHIIECGQVFRYKKTVFGYEVYSLNHKAIVYCQKDNTIIECDDVNYFINYFDLDTDYDKIKLELKHDEMLQEAIKFGYGIRILKQNNIEAIINFIISANNNIPRIKKIIENICTHYGANMGDYFAFPTLSQLSSIPKEFFTKSGAGYRADYLNTPIQNLANDFNVNDIYSLPAEQAVKKLLTLKGVGPKVADCILLYGFAFKDVFPTDTWIIKVFNDYAKTFSDNKGLVSITNPVQMRNYFVTKFKHLSGYAQQYLFYYKRSNKI